MKPVLSILGTGLYLPPARSIREMSAALGADTGSYNGWDNGGVAKDDEHPSTMGAQVLREALNRSGVDPAQLSLVISAGMSRDYLPSWSVAAECMRLVGVPHTCLPLDITSGCMGALAGLDIALAWLSNRGEGYAAVVAAEKVSYTIDRSNAGMNGLWPHSDGAGAVIVSLNGTKHSLGEFAGAEFFSISELNGTVLIKYGGTRFPCAPPGVNPVTREFLAPSKSEIGKLYSAGYTGALNAMYARFNVHPRRLICNQMSPNMLKMISDIAGMPPGGLMVTGHDTGHVGSVDIVVGFHRTLAVGKISEPIALAASTPYVFGAGLLRPPTSD
jgi:3-oxoacyl-[acyl-carrier-protein] synthase III